MSNEELKFRTDAKEREWIKQRNDGAARRILEKAGIEFEEVLADENPELVAEFGVKQAPTLVVISDGNAEVISNVSNIRAFTESVKV